MTYIVNKTIGEAHDNIMRHLIKLWKIEDEEEVNTEDNERTIESPGMKVRVNSPWEKPKVSPALQFGPKALQKYIKELTEITPITGTIKDFEYTYGNRIFDYPIYTPDAWFGDGEGDGINQISESIINRLTKNPTSRRAIAVTWVVQKDMKSKEPPCLQLVQCLIRNNKLNLHAVFRSHDMASGWGPNMYGLESLQQLILFDIQNNINNPDLIEQLSQGYIETYSISAHMYINQDQVIAFRRYLNI